VSGPRGGPERRPVRGRRRRHVAHPRRRHKDARREGTTHGQGEVVLVVEAMKMENSATDPRTGIVALLRVAAGDSTPQDAILCVLA